MDYIAELKMEATLSFLVPMIFSVLVADALFFIRLRRRKNIILRLLLSVACYIAVAFFLSPILVNYVVRSGAWWLYFILSIVLGCVCFKHGFIDILFCVTCAFAVMNSLYILVELIGWISTGEELEGAAFVLTYIAVAAVVYVAVYYFISRKIKKDSDIIEKNNYIIIFIAVILLFGSTDYFNYLPYQTPVQNWLTRLFRIGINIVIIMLMMAYRNNKELVNEKAVMLAMIEKGNEQFKSMREYMEVIEIKCHDFKKMMSVQDFEEGVNREIAIELAQSVEEYRNTPKTGIAALDVVLYDKIIICKKNGIMLTYMIDGDDLNKLKPVDVATIFNNLIYNAIEYVKTLADEDKRLISLNVQTQFNCLFIAVENYCESTINFIDGLPVTSKGENHGFGLKSIKYSVEKYGGAIDVRREDNIFAVNIIIPMQT